ncbi:unnamed protein product [Owenia fusiformis]|uniref:Uncharacterized protein n=1 Tax=Owenia fusiformis TaxID=6347 RepID=A0A8J1XZC2_OWEFU|nr:unnamed protein product [Owenia fusiformis]
MLERISSILALSFMVIFLSSFNLTFVRCQGKVEQSEDGKSGKLSFSTPDLSDEEAHSQFMPEQLKCDGCRIIAYQLYTKFDQFNSIRPSLKYKIKESDYLDLIEQVCQYKYDDYGVKEVNRVKRLSGPGLETADIPGVMQGGGKWPARLMAMCDDYVGEIGEDEIYEAYTKNPKSLVKFEDYLCRGEGILSRCSKFDPSKDEL